MERASKFSPKNYADRNNNGELDEVKNKVNSLRLSPLRQKWLVVYSKDDERWAVQKEDPYNLSLPAKLKFKTLLKDQGVPEEVVSTILTGVGEFNVKGASKALARFQLVQTLRSIRDEIAPDYGLEVALMGSGLLFDAEISGKTITTNRAELKNEMLLHIKKYLEIVKFDLSRLPQKTIFDGDSQTLFLFIKAGGSLFTCPRFLASAHLNDTKDLLLIGLLVYLSRYSEILSPEHLRIRAMFVVNQLEPHNADTFTGSFQWVNYIEDMANENRNDNPNGIRDKKEAYLDIIRTLAYNLLAKKTGTDAFVPGEWGAPTDLELYGLFTPLWESACSDIKKRISSENKPEPLSAETTTTTTTTTRASVSPDPEGSRRPPPAASFTYWGPSNQIQERPIYEKEGANRLSPGSRKAVDSDQDREKKAKRRNPKTRGGDGNNLRTRASTDQEAPIAASPRRSTPSSREKPELRRREASPTDQKPHARALRRTNSDSALTHSKPGNANETPSLYRSIDLATKGDREQTPKAKGPERAKNRNRAPLVRRPRANNLTPAFGASTNNRPRTISLSPRPKNLPNDQRIETLYSAPSPRLWLQQADKGVRGALQPEKADTRPPPHRDADNPFWNAVEELSNSIIGHQPKGSGTGTVTDMLEGALSAGLEPIPEI